MTVPGTGATEVAGDGTGDAATTVITAMTDREILGGKAEEEGGAEAAPLVLREVADGATIWGGAEFYACCDVPVSCPLDLFLCLSCITSLECLEIRGTLTYRVVLVFSQRLNVVCEEA